MWQLSACWDFQFLLGSSMARCTRIRQPRGFVQAFRLNVPHIWPGGALWQLMVPEKPLPSGAGLQLPRPEWGAGLNLQPLGGMWWIPAV